MKMYIAALTAAALLLSAAGCAQIETVDIDSSNQAYSRVLYNESDSYADSDSEEEDIFFEETVAEERTEQTVHEAENRVESKKDTISKEERIPASSSSRSVDLSPQSSSAVSSKTVSSDTGSLTISSRASSSRVTDSDKHLNNSSARKSSSSSVSSYKKTDFYVADHFVVHRADSDTDLKSASSNNSNTVKKDLHYKLNGVFEESDLYYNDWDYIYLADNEEWVRSVKGDPSIETIDEHDGSKIMVYDDCTITFVKDEAVQEYLVKNIKVPYNSFYSTFKGIETGSPSSLVIEAYGQPNVIEPYPPKPASPLEQNNTDNSDIDSTNSEDPSEDTESDEVLETDTTNEDVSSNHTVENGSGDPEDEINDNSTDSAAEKNDADNYKQTGEIYIYIIGDKSLSFLIKNGKVSQMEYNWNVGDTASVS